MENDENDEEEEEEEEEELYMINGNFTFHGIGQGLFYSGFISSNDSEIFSFVYDCGTSLGKEKLLKCEIVKTFRKKDGNKYHLDALFISHFDKDHISGIPDLLKECEIDSVYFPYLSPELALSLAINDGIDRNDALFELYVRPKYYFLEHECKNIFVIDPESEQSENAREEKAFNDIEKSSFKLYGNIRNEQYKKPFYKCHGSTEIIVGNDIWKFVFFQDRMSLRDIVTSKLKILFEHHDIIFTDSDNVIITNEIIYKVINNPRLIKEIHRLYKSILGNTNQSSLVLYHSPINDAFSKELCSECLSKKYCFEVENYNEMLCNYCCNSATLLTGDINLNKLEKNGITFKNSIINQKNKVGVIQIPHHGSKNNTSINLLKTCIDDNITFICCYGRGNPYNHPNAYMLDHLMESFSSSVKHVNENQGFQYCIKGYI